MFVIAWLSLLAGDSVAQDRDNGFRQLSTKEGLRLRVVRAIDQDENGYIWLGAVNKLIKYDGHTFQEFGDPIIEHRSIRQVVSDGSNRKRMLLTDNDYRKEILFFNEDPELLFVFSEKFDINPFPEISFPESMQITRNRNPIILTSCGAVFLIEKESLRKIFQSPVDKPNDDLIVLDSLRMFIHSNNQLFLYASQKSSYLGMLSMDLESKKFDVFAPRSKGHHLALKADDSGMLWSGHSSFLTQYIRESTDKTFEFEGEGTRGSHNWAIWEVYFDPVSGFEGPHKKDSLLSKFKNIPICHLFIDEQGVFWLATDGNGLIRWDRDNGRYDIFDQITGLLNNHIHAVYEDEEQSLWLPSYNGLMRFDKETHGVHHFTTKNGQICMSRKNLHRKLKALTGQSPSTFIRVVRLKASLELLQSGKYNVSEVSFLVGFNSPTYFSKCFQEYYGFSPRGVSVHHK